jgi:hypothetical protein
MMRNTRMNFLGEVRVYAPPEKNLNSFIFNILGAILMCFGDFK